MFVPIRTACRGAPGTFPGGLEDWGVCFAVAQKALTPQLRMTVLPGQSGPVLAVCGRENHGVYGRQNHGVYGNLPCSPPSWCCRLEKKEKKKTSIPQHIQNPSP